MPTLSKQKIEDILLIGIYDDEDNETVLIMAASRALTNLINEYETVKAIQKTSEEYQSYIRHADNFFKFLLNQIRPEVSLALIDQAIQKDLELNNLTMPYHKEWFAANYTLWKHPSGEIWSV